MADIQCRCTAACITSDVAARRMTPWVIRTSASRAHREREGMVGGYPFVPISRDGILQTFSHDRTLREGRGPPVLLAFWHCSRGPVKGRGAQGPGAKSSPRLHAGFLCTPGGVREPSGPQRSGGRGLARSGPPATLEGTEGKTRNHPARQGRVPSSADGASASSTHPTLRLASVAAGATSGRGAVTVAATSSRQTVGYRGERRRREIPIIG